jgi:hypothetical protein
MAATHCVTQLLAPGDHIVTGTDIYGGTWRLFNKVLAQHGITLTAVNTPDTDAVARAVTPATRPGFLLNVTNDAWFGVSAGPHQHLASARLRAVEEGLPMVRAAQTGISAVFDSRGRVVARLGLAETSVLLAPLPRPGAPTVFGRLGLLAPLLLLAAAALLWWRACRQGTHHGPLASGG